MDRRMKSETRTGMTVFTCAAIAALALTGALALSACSNAPADSKETTMEETGAGSAASQAATSNGTAGAYRAITAGEAQDMMAGGDVTIVDVRTPQEYTEGHIPGAINIPLDRIGTEQPAELADPGAELIVYCRTGVRSKQASDKLVDLVYEHVNDMGGIVDWTGDVVTGDQPN